MRSLGTRRREHIPIIETHQLRHKLKTFTMTEVYVLRFQYGAEAFGC